MLERVKVTDDDDDDDVQFNLTSVPIGIRRRKVLRTSMGKKERTGRVMMGGILISAPSNQPRMNAYEASPSVCSDSYTNQLEKSFYRGRPPLPCRV